MSEPERTLTKLLSELSPESPEERERREQGRQRLKERLSSIPWYAQQAQKDGEIFWDKLYASCARA